MKNISSKALLSGSLALLCITAHQTAFPYKSIANGLLHSACPDSGTTGSIGECYGTPSQYKVTFYEIGLCTEDPLTSTTSPSDYNLKYANTDYAIDQSSCVQLFASTTGNTLDLANKQSFDLAATNLDIEDGSYAYSYMKVSSLVSIKAKHKYGSDAFCSTSTGGENNSTGNSSNINYQFPFPNDCTPEVVSHATIDFRGSAGECSGWRDEMAYVVDLDSGKLKQILATESALTRSGVYSGANSCTSDNTIIFMSFKPTSPLIINTQTTGLDIQFTVTKRGVVINECGGVANSVCSFTQGVFSPEISTY